MKHDLFHIKRYFDQKKTKRNEEQKLPIKYLKRSKRRNASKVWDRTAEAPHEVFDTSRLQLSYTLLPASRGILFHHFIITLLMLFYFKYIFVIETL